MSSRDITGFEPTGHGVNVDSNNYHPHPPGPAPPHTNNNNHGQNVVDTGSPMSQHHGGHIPQPFVFGDIGQVAQQQQQQPQHQQIHPSFNGPQNGRHTPEAQQGPPPQMQTAPSGGEIQKSNRLRKACDSCSIRKVKCDESGPPCKACKSLEIPCTRNRPSRRRGPPNRHAEAIKKRRFGFDSPIAGESGGGGGFESPTSPNNVAATLASFSSHAVLNAESICPFETLELLVDDFFTYIHPLCPFPHEPSFRAAFNTRQDLSNPAFLALLASMVGTLVASFPRKPRLHLKRQRREHLFPNSISLVERCHKVAVEARGSGYLDKDLTVYDAATSYFLGLSAAYTFQWRQCRLYFGETLTITRVLGAHRVKDIGYQAAGGFAATFGADGTVIDPPVQPVVDCIKQEIGRRIFWIMLVGIRSMQQFGASFGELIIPPSTPNEPYPPFPLETDDEYIFVDHIDSQPPGIISKLTGFNIGIRIYLTTSPVATMEMAYGIDEVFDWSRQKRIVEESLLAAKEVLNGIPPQLLLQPRPEPEGFQSDNQQYFPPATDYPGARLNGANFSSTETTVEGRRNLQYEIQKANIYASQLATRSYLVEKYWNLQDSYEKRKASMGSPENLTSPSLASGLVGLLPKQEASNPDRVEEIVFNEREAIVQDLLQVLGSISQTNMEPNSGSFINKIRQIASTLIGTQQQRKGPLALKNEEYLARFLEVLMKLERVSPGLKNETGEIDEEEELRHWADLRQYQLAFMQAGGFMTEIG